MKGLLVKQPRGMESEGAETSTPSGEHEAGIPTSSGDGEDSALSEG